MSAVRAGGGAGRVGEGGVGGCWLPWFLPVDAGAECSAGIADAEGIALVAALPMGSRTTDEPAEDPALTEELSAAEGTPIGLDDVAAPAADGDRLPVPATTRAMAPATTSAPTM